MADVISRLRLDSGEFDSKIKRAGQELMAYSEHCRKTGLEMGYANRDAKEFAKALGNMQTTSSSARGKINELSEAFVNLKVMYKNMTDEERNNTFGKNLAASLDNLKTRINTAKKDLADVTAELNGKSSAGGGFLSGIDSKMEGALAVFGGNLMTKAAGAVAQLGSEMYGMVQQGIEMARAGEGVRIAFERLGRGDLLDGLRQATHGTVTDLELMKAAVKFNDFKLPLDQLGTMLAFAQQKAKDTGQSVDYMVDSIVTGLGRKSLMILDNLGLSATEIKEKMKQTGDMTKAVGQIIREQMAKAGDYVETAADRAAQANVNLQNKMEELGRKFAPVEEASNQLWTSMKIGILDIVGGPLARLLNGLTEAGRMRNALNDMGGNEQVNTQLGKLRVAKAAGSGYMTRSLYSEQVEQYNRQINTSSQQLKDIRAWQSGERGEALQGRIGVIRDKYGSLDATKVKAEIDATKYMLAQYRQGAQQIMNATSSTKSGTTTTGGKGGKDTKTEQTELQKNQSKINELTQQFIDIYSAAAAAGKPLTKEQEKLTEEIQKQIEFLKGRNELIGMWGEMAEGKLTKNNVLSKTPGSLISPKEASEKTIDVAVPRGGLQLSDKAMNAVQKNINKQQKGVGNIADEWSDVASAIGAVGNAMSAIEDPAAKVLGIVAQAIATVALTFSKSLAGTIGPWDWIAAAAAGTATMISTISAIHSATGYAEGGMIKGNSYSGDNLMAMGPNGALIGLNAGEIVLNKSQQNNLASQLQGGGMQNLNLTATIKGEQIRLALNNNGRRTGRGEYVQSRNVR